MAKEKTQKKPNGNDSGLTPKDIQQHTSSLAELAYKQVWKL